PLPASAEELDYAFHAVAAPCSRRAIYQDQGRPVGDEELFSYHYNFKTGQPRIDHAGDRKSTRLNSSHVSISYAVFCLKKKKGNTPRGWPRVAKLRAKRPLRRTVLAEMPRDALVHAPAETHDVDARPRSGAQRRRHSER